MRQARSTSVLRLVWVVSGAVLAVAPFSPAPCSDLTLPLLRLEEVTTDLRFPGPSGFPVALTHAGDERIFLTIKAGLVVVFDGRRVLPEPFLDITDRVLDTGEQGFLSVAFPPDYPSSGRFFVDYVNRQGDTVLARYSVSQDPNRADPESGVTLLTLPQPFDLHKGGQLQFGPDGKLYVSTGDGGDHHDPFCLAQDRRSLLGKILRLDVGGNPDPPFYRVPPDNPRLVPGEPPSEVWALGLRNPWRFSFDRVTGDLWIGDVGESGREEINFQPASSRGGENYGWKRMEGSLCQGVSGCEFEVPDCHSPELVLPVVEYSHQRGRCAVIGGSVYRGARFPALTGLYFFGDFCAGTIWAARRERGAWQFEKTGLSVPGLTSFGEDAAGEVYVTAFGRLLRLAAAAPEPCVSDATTLCLHQGRFKAEVRWYDAQGETGPGRAGNLTAESGFFWFFHPDNVEVMLKVLDACFDPFQRFWVFAAGLTNVATEITLTDTRAGLVRRYSTPSGQPFAPLQDTRAFACP